MEILTGPRGGQYYIDENGKKKYIKKTRKEKSSIQSNPTRRDSKTTQPRRKNSNDNTSSGQKILMECYVPDVEHEGDVDWQISQLRKIGNIEIVNIDREYTDDGEELTFACINFKCNQKDFKAFEEYCSYQ